jgi:hypothetical protein
MGQKSFQAQASPNSFYMLMSNSAGSWDVPALASGQNPFVMLDLQYSGLNLLWGNEVVAYINFGNIQLSRFGFPFAKVPQHQ